MSFPHFPQHISQNTDQNRTIMNWKQKEWDLFVFNTELWRACWREEVSLERLPGWLVAEYQVVTCYFPLSQPLGIHMWRSDAGFTQTLWEQSMFTTCLRQYVMHHGEEQKDGVKKWKLQCWNGNVLVLPWFLLSFGIIMKVTNSGSTVPPIKAHNENICIKGIPALHERLTVAPRRSYPTLKYQDIIQEWVYLKQSCVRTSVTFVHGRYFKSSNVP